MGGARADMCVANVGPTSDQGAREELLHLGGWRQRLAGWAVGLLAAQEGAVRRYSVAHGRRRTVLPDEVGVAGVSWRTCSAAAAAVRGTGTSTGREDLILRGGREESRTAASDEGAHVDEVGQSSRTASRCPPSGQAKRGWAGGTATNRVRGDG